MLDEIASDSLAQLLASATASNLGPPNTPSWSSLSHGDVVDIQGPASSGKTHLIYLFLIICITPSEQQGWDKAAIVFDMDGSFNITRFNCLLLGRLMRSFSCDMNVAQTVAQRSLQRLHIFRPTSSSQLAATLTQLGRYHTTHLAGSQIGLVAIDSINAYHWPDRFTAEHIRTSSLPSILTALSSLRATHAPAIIMSSRGLQSSGASALVDCFNPTHRITLSALHSPQFQEDMPVATDERNHQREGVETAEIRVSMRLVTCSIVEDFVLHVAEEEVKC